VNDGYDDEIPARPHDPHEDEFDDEYGEQRPSGDPRNDTHVSLLSISNVTDEIAEDLARLGVTDFKCPLMPSLDGEYDYTVEYHRLNVMLSGSQIGYTKPDTLWTLQGEMLEPPTSGTATLSVDVQLPDPLARGYLRDVGTRTVTVHYIATPWTLHISNEPTDGTYGLDVGFDVAEVSIRDNLPSISSGTRSILMSGQRLIPSPELVEATRACKDREDQIKHAAIRPTVNVVPHIDQGDPARLSREPDSTPAQLGHEIDAAARSIEHT
jgi:hypothetical protein